MPATVYWWGAGLLVAVTVYWAAVWWWLPKAFDDYERKRNRERDDHAQPRG